MIMSNEMTAERLYSLMKDPEVQRWQDIAMAEINNFAEDSPYLEAKAYLDSIGFTRENFIKFGSEIKEMDRLEESQNNEG
jgi:hypothetical protein